MDKYDVIIAGGSFAGLAAASVLKGRILLVDRYGIGEKQTSACGSFCRTLEELKCGKSVLQKFDKIAAHFPTEREIGVAETMCTFDYKTFCREFAGQTSAEILRAEVKGVKGDVVVTDRGSFKGLCIVDCTGWKAVLASSLRDNFVDKSKLCFGIETVIDYQDDRLRYFLDDKIIEKGVAWIFPAGEKSGIGVASYTGRTNLLPELRRFLNGMGLKLGPVHGGYIPYGLREPVVDSIFLAGDSAGHALPLTAEGIRKSISFGKECGRTVQKIINAEITPEEGLEEYRKFVGKSRTAYNYLLSLQNKLVEGKMPAPLLQIINSGIVSGILLKQYLKF